MLRHAGKSAAIIVIGFKSPLEPIVEYTYQGIIAEANGGIT
jgi:hypothetical protein